MHEEFVNGRLKSSTFSPFVWGRICDRLNATLAPTYVYTIEQLKGKLKRLRRAWRLLNDLISGGAGWGWNSQLNTVIDEHGRLEELYRANPEYKKIIEHGLPHFDLCTEMFSRNIATGAWGRSATHGPRSSHGEHGGTDEMQVENDHSTHVGSRRSRDEYEDTAYSESMLSVPLNEPSVPLNEPFESFPIASDDDFASPSSGRRGKRHVNDLQTKKMDTMDKVQESLQGKIERTGPKATEAIERCVEELSKFENLPDQIFTTALERFHSHTTRTMFLKLTENNKLRWLQSLAKLN
ncbi:hypothetical protein Salat_2747100 [Sesamum alatum]|uniref:Myb/SANT-like domain-containing protein n=1 Tax=Sesamum alatum TaxID=300844 RepID=A0AAE2C956_9LAMI|nr:hypothetical protein Salat_2747100 [Sesamum alatum]